MARGLPEVWLLRLSTGRSRFNVVYERKFNAVQTRLFKVRNTSNSEGVRGEFIYMSYLYSYGLVNMERKCTT